MFNCLHLGTIFETNMYFQISLAENKIVIGWKELITLYIIPEKNTFHGKIFIIDFLSRFFFISILTMAILLPIAYKIWK